MHVVETINGGVSFRKKCSGSVGFVPTMGALHAGHLELVKHSLKTCKTTIVSIFVNPKQFAVSEDLNSYPNNLNEDLALLKRMHVDCVFMPNKTEMYSEKHSVELVENKLSKVLEGNSRPLFFSGVLTIVSKLFNVFIPTDVFFGQKDAQQLIIVQKLIRDMNYNIRCHSVPTVRDKNGLALSSRNEYLDDKGLQTASNIYKSLCLVKTKLDNGEKNVSVLKKKFNDYIEQCDDLVVDYFSIADAETLQEISTSIKKKVLISTAVIVNGKVRLIDNIEYSM